MKWTPTLDCTGGAFSSVQYDALTRGTFVRSLHRVDFHGFLKTYSHGLGTAQGSVLIGGLPVPSSPCNVACSVQIGNSSDFANHRPSSGIIQPGETYIRPQYRSPVNGDALALPISALAPQHNIIYVSGSYVPDTKVAFVGDSITVSWPLTDLVANPLNFGVGGEGALQMNVRTAAVIAANPAVAHILAGTNDVVGENPNLAGAVEYLRQMAATLRSAGIAVIIGKIPPRITDGVTLARCMEHNALIGAMCEANGFRTVDYYNATVLIDGTQDPTLFPDGCHPNAKGYRFMGVELQRELATL
jgi:lysophospholipase L1-like esterase